MKDTLDNKILALLKQDLRMDYTIPEFMRRIDVRNRENVVEALARLEGMGMVEVSREKGRSKYFRLKMNPGGIN